MVEPIRPGLPIQPPYHANANVHFTRPTCPSKATTAVKKYLSNPDLDFEPTGYIWKPDWGYCYHCGERPNILAFHIQTCMYSDRLDFLSSTVFNFISC